MYLLMVLVQEPELNSPPPTDTLSLQLHLEQFPLKET